MALDGLVENSKVTFLAWQGEGREKKRDGGSGWKASWRDGPDRNAWREVTVEANDDDG